MRMTKRKKELLYLYQRERARGFQARWALANARTRLEWDKQEVAEFSSGDPCRGSKPIDSPNKQLSDSIFALCSLCHLESRRRSVSQNSLSKIQG
jgi:hypothetical protein